VFILVVELTTELIKYQRRQYFRLGCTIDINYKDISKEEYEILLNSQTFDDKLLELDGVVLDISGGGMRFVSGKRLLKEQIIMINLEVSYGNNNNKYSLFVKIITSN